MVIRLEAKLRMRSFGVEGEEEAVVIVHCRSYVCHFSFATTREREREIWK